jgi:hypothetical protein
VLEILFKDSDFFGQVVDSIKGVAITNLRGDHGPILAIRTSGDFSGKIFSIEG